MRWANSSAFRYALLSLSLCLYISQCRFDLLASWNRISIDWVELLGTNKNSRTKKKHGTIETRNSCALYLHANVRLLVWPCLYGYSPFARFPFFLFFCPALLSVVSSLHIVPCSRFPALIRFDSWLLTIHYRLDWRSSCALIFGPLHRCCCPLSWMCNTQWVSRLRPAPCLGEVGMRKRGLGKKKKTKKKKEKYAFVLREISWAQVTVGGCWFQTIALTPPRHTHTRRAPVLLLKSRSRNKRHTVAAACPWKSLESWLSSSSDVACNNSPVAECHLLAN